MKTLRFRRRPSTFVESLIVMMLLCFILFGLLQLIHIGVAKMIAEYSAFNAVRSAAVGFRTELVERAGLIGAIGAMGTLQQPDLGYDRASPVSQFGSEINLIPEYMTGEIYWLKYKYSPHFQFSEHQDGMGMRAAEITFKDYPFEFPMWQAFSLKPSIDLKGEARMTDHASFFLEF